MLVSLYIVTFIVFAILLVSKPHEIVRPSIWFCVGMVVVINGAAAFTGPELDYGYRAAWTMRCMSIVFPLGVLVWVLLTPRLSFVASALYRSCQSTSLTEHYCGVERRTLLFFCVVSTTILMVYLQVVPIMSTGLAAIFSNPEGASMARERSLSLLSSITLKYGYRFHTRVSAPIIVALLAQWKPGGYVRRGMRLVFIIAAILSVMLTGERSPAGFLLVILALVYYLRNGGVRGGIGLLCVAATGMLIATLLTIFREGRIAELSPSLIMEYTRLGTFGRTFITPFRTGVWTNLYAYEHGLPGIQNIRPLALLFGMEYTNLPNAVAMANLPNPIPSATANTCFLFDYQASFGLAMGWLLSLLLLCFLDSGLLVLCKLRGRLLLSFLATLMLAVLMLLFSAYTTSLVTHGILITLILAACCGTLQRIRVSMSGSGLTGGHASE